MLVIQGKYEGIKQGLFTFVNPYSYVVLSREITKEDLNEFVLYADGIFIVWIERLINKVYLNRVSFDFTSIAGMVFEQVENEKKIISFVGSSEEYIIIFEKVIRSLYPNMVIDVCCSGYFKDNEHRRKVVDKLSSSDVVVVGMGAPLQERFLLDLKDTGWAGSGYTCGGFIEQTAVSNGVYYPDLVDKMNLRWLYRLIKEPRKLWYRYVIQYPFFILFYLREWVK